MTAEAMRHLEETADAAMVGWAKAAAEVEKLTAELDEAREQVAVAEDRRAGAVLRERQALAERDEARAAIDRVRKQRESVLKLISDAYTDAGADVQEGGAWPSWGPSIDALDVLEALGALDGSGT